MIGKHLGQYEILSELGAGGMAVVYRARQAAIDRDVAIKIIQPERRDAIEFLKRFRREAKTIASLSHPHIVKVFDYGEHEGMVYLVMELLRGGSLSDEIARRPMSGDQVAFLLAQIASAIDYAHERGVIHRDLKPQNVLLDEKGNAFITDFGLARLMEGDSTITQSHTIMGTPAYMSPEQWLDSPLDARSDIYSLGVIMYEMLSGKLPFEATTPYAIMHKTIDEAPPPIRTLRPELPPALDSVVVKALAKDPRQRYESATSLAQHLQGSLSGTLPALRAVEQATYEAQRAAIQRTATPELRDETAIVRSAPHPAPYILIGIIMLLALSGIAFLLSRVSNSHTGTLLSATPPAVLAGLPTLLPVETRAASTLTKMETLTAVAISSFTPTSDLRDQQTLVAIVGGSQTAVAIASATKTPTVTPTPTRRMGLRIALVMQSQPNALNQNSLQGARDAAKILSSTVDTHKVDTVSDEVDAAKSYADHGYDVVVIADFQLHGEIEQIAPQYPRTHFFSASGSWQVVSNVSLYVEPNDNINFLTGALAASLSQSGTIAFLTPFRSDTAYTEHAFTSGAQYINPKIKITVKDNPNKDSTDADWATQAAQSALSDGADVLLAVGGGPAEHSAYAAFSQTSTKAKPLYCVGTLEDAFGANPDATCIVTSVLALQGLTLREAILDFADGKHDPALIPDEFGFAPFRSYQGFLSDKQMQKLTQIHDELVNDEIQPN